MVEQMASQGSLPQGTVTFLFTDIEGSTRLLERLGRDDRVRRARDEDLSTVCGLADASAAVDSDPDIAVAAERGLARVQPHPYTHLCVPWPPLG